MTRSATWLATGRSESEQKPNTERRKLIPALRQGIRPLNGTPTDYDALVDMVGDASYVLIGEATHSTHEFYQERAEITKRLISEKGFVAVAVEADWPDAYRVNRYVRGVASICACLSS